MEKVFLVASFFYITYIVAGVSREARLEGCADGHRQAAARATCAAAGLCYMVIGMVGTTIAPWMQFYLQASIVEKG